MKRNEKRFKVGLLILLCGGLYAFQLLKAAPVSLTLEEAIAQKKVTCKLTSTGNYSGESVSVALTNLTGSPLQITIPPGTVFKPSDEGDQDLIVVEQQVLALNAKATNIQVADGFCMEAHDSSPAENNGMKMTKTTNAKLQELAGFLNGKQYDSYTIQEAVWAVSDGEEISSIGNDTQKDKDLRAFLSKLTGKPDPWYATKQRHTLTEERLIESNPVSVSGRISFVSDGKIKIHEVVKNARGEVKNTSEDLEFPRQGKWNYQFVLTVQGWEKGNYTVDVMDGTKVLQTFPFTI